MFEQGKVGQALSSAEWGGQQKGEDIGFLSLRYAYTASFWVYCEHLVIHLWTAVRHP